MLLTKLVCFNSSRNVEAARAHILTTMLLIPTLQFTGVLDSPVISLVMLVPFPRLKLPGAFTVSNRAGYALEYFGYFVLKRR
jgi:hypothetical protein